MGQAASSLRPFGSTSSPASTRCWKYGLLALAAIVALLDLFAISAWERSVDPAVHGTLLAGFDPAVQTGGWQTITKLDAASPLRKAGASVGDAVRFHHRGEAWLRRFGTDERIELELRSEGTVRALTVQPIDEAGFSPSQAIPG